MAKKGGAPTKSEVLTQISKDTALSRKQVASVFDSLGGVIKKSLRGNGLFTLPGLMKLKVVKKPATKAREGINPFTGEKMTFKAKPASKKVRVLPLKSLKAMVNNWLSISEIAQAISRNQTQRPPCGGLTNELTRRGAIQPGFSFQGWWESRRAAR